MARSEFGTITKRAGAFLNRHDQLRAFSLILDRVLDRRGHLVVLEVIGLGGAGKTSLLREFRMRERSSGAKPVIVSVPLVAEAGLDRDGAVTGGPGPSEVQLPAVRSRHRELLDSNRAAVSSAGRERWIESAP